MGEVVFVGLGLHDELGMSLRGVEEVRSANEVFMELYTSLLPGLSFAGLAEICGKKPIVLSRKDLEEDNGAIVLEKAKRTKVVLLVPGDPLIATTHVVLRIEAEKRGIKTRVVHGTSFLSAVIGLSGLHNYKFGKSVTVPFSENPSETPYEVISQNKKLGLHTLCLLDVKAEEDRYLGIHSAIRTLLEIEKKKQQGALTPDALGVGIARAGSHNPTVKAGCLKELLSYDFGGPPQCLIIPGRLHFMEAEALIVLAGANSRVRELAE